jgi:hypothetical protein
MEVVINHHIHATLLQGSSYWIGEDVDPNHHTMKAYGMALDTGKWSTL